MFGFPTVLASTTTVENGLDGLRACRLAECAIVQVILGGFSAHEADRVEYTDKHVRIIVESPLNTKALGKLRETRGCQTLP